MKRFLTSLLLAIAIGCGSSSGKDPQKWALKPAEPPSYPTAKPQPVAPVLQQQAMKQLTTAQNSPDPYVRAHVVEAWQDVAGEGASTVIIQGLSDKEPVVRFASVMAVGQLKLREAYWDLQKMLKDPDLNVQVALRFALHRLGDKSHSHDLEKYALAPDGGVRANTVMVLGLLGEPSALKILRKMVSDKSPAVRLQVAESRWRLGDMDGLKDLVTGVVSAYPDDQISSILAIAQPRDQRVTEHVRGGLTADYVEVRLVAARAMGMLGSDEGYGVAMEGIKSSDPRQRSLAALAFGAIGRSDAQTMLQPLLNDPNDDVRLSAATAILELKSDSSSTAEASNN